jgi:hypothetical protein
VFTALARCLALGVFLVGREALFPPDETEHAIGGNGGVRERLLVLASERRDESPALRIVEAVDDEIRIAELF